MALIDDEWRVHKDINPGYGLWTGSTTFIVGRAIDQEAELWVRPEKLDVRGGIPRDQMLPQAVGHCWRKEAGEREVVYGMSGPGRWPLAEESGRLEEMLVFDRAGPPGS